VRGAAVTGTARLAPPGTYRPPWRGVLDRRGKQAQTQVKRISSTCDMLAADKRRVYRSDRSGRYGKAFAAPQAQ